MKRTTDWIQTVTGRKFWPLEPSGEDIDIADIAHALSLKCRFAGHCIEFYSVAQHSLLIAQRVPPADALWALLHDATEAYLPDVARPVKQSLPGFKEVESRLMQVIARRYGLLGDMPKSVKVEDTNALATEQRDLMVESEEWQGTLTATPWDAPIIPWASQTAERLFLAAFETLAPRFETLPQVDPVRAAVRRSSRKLFDRMNTYLHAKSNDSQAG